MDHFHALPEEYRSQHGHIADGSGQDALVVAHLDGQIVDLQATGYIANATAVPVGVRQHDDLNADGKLV